MKKRIGIACIAVLLCVCAYLAWNLPLREEYSQLSMPELEAACPQAVSDLQNWMQESDYDTYRYETIHVRTYENIAGTEFLEILMPYFVADITDVPTAGGPEWYLHCGVYGLEYRNSTLVKAEYRTVEEGTLELVLDDNTVIFNTVAYVSGGVPEKLTVGKDFFTREVTLGLDEEHTAPCDLEFPVATKDSTIDLNEQTAMEFVFRGSVKTPALFGGEAVTFELPGEEAYINNVK